MGEEQECRKGQNLEMIVSKLAKEKPSNGLGNLILISGVNIQNLSFPNDEEEGEEEPDLHQCGKCKHMFMNLERYLRHRTEKQCRKKPHESQNNSDDGRSPNHMPEVVQMEATMNNYQEYDGENQDLTNKRRHERKGVARKRTHGMLPERNSTDMTGGVHTKRVNIDRLQEIIHPEYSTATPYMVATRGNYTSSEPGLPNNNDLYALMELTKNSGIKEAHEEHSGDTGQRHELMNGEVLTTYYSLPTMRSPSNTRGSAALAAHKPLSALSTAGVGLLPYTGVETAEVLTAKGGKRRYKCEKCDREFNQRANLRRHQLVHSGEKPYECVQCHRRFQQQGDLKRHMLRHAESASYHCHICEKKFMRVDRWKMHLKTHVENGELPEGEIAVGEETNGTAEGIEEDGGKPLVSHHNCSKCNQTFMEPDELLVHTCADGNISVTTVGVESRETDEAEGGTATMAEGIGRNVAADADHSRTYSSSRSASKGKLTNPHKCPLCNAYYKNVDSLKTHILKHSGEKKYKCDQCPKAFFTSSNLKIHKRIHSGDKPLKCKICFKAFSDPSNFNKHKKSHTKGKTETRAPGKRGKNSRGGTTAREVKEEPAITEGSSGNVGEPVVASVSGGMEFGSQTREFVQSQYEALLPALGDNGGPEEGEGKPDEELETVGNDEEEYTVPFIESPSF